MSTLWLTTGQPGSGKTYSRVRWLVSDFLPNTKGLYITNLPLNIDLIAEYLFEKRSIPIEETKARIVIIPQEEFNFWVSIRTMEPSRRGGDRDKYLSPETYPPFVFLKQYELKNSHIAIDEFHQIFGKYFSTDILKLWGDWLSEVRKEGATFEAITQSLDKLSNEYISLVGLRIDLVQCRNLRDPLFKISMFDWYQLREGFTGFNEERVMQTEYIKGTSFTGRVKWKEQKFDKFTLSPAWWKFYNSYTKSTGEQGGNTTPAQQYGKSIWRWFLRRNFFPLLTRGFVVLALLWLFFGGGSQYFMSIYMHYISTGMGLGPKVSTASHSSASPSSVSQGQLKTMQQANALYAVGPSPDELKAFRPALFFDKSCWLKNSIRIHIGYKFKGGPHDGKVVTKIDASDRFYEFDNLDRVYMFD